MDRSGAPFQIRGASPWCIVQLSQADVRYLLDDVADKGFNSIVMMSALSPSALAQYGPANYYGQTPFVDADFTPNEAFWSQVDFILDEAALRGIVVQITPLYSGHASAGDGWETYVSAATEAECTAFGEWFGSRYRNRGNLIIVLGGDRIPTGGSAAKWQAIWDGIVSQDPNHLVTGHPARGESGRDFGSIVTLNSTYRAYTAVASGTLEDYQDTPTLPTFGFELHYSGNGTTWGSPDLTTSQVRVEAWQCLLSGGCGANYGDHTVWPLGVEAGVVFADWKPALDDPAAQDMVHLHAFFDAIDWWTLVPDATSTFVTAGRSSAENYVAAAFTSSVGVAVIPAGGQITVDMSEFSGPLLARWFDPSSGQYDVISGSDVTPLSNTGTLNFDPPLNDDSATDMVLLLEVA